ncbi:MAG: DUF4159 domain-containing protein [Planctomycetes bacterium]|nr:DUF4159 domain-containing protein [Planctomycetota bacterium]
MLTRGLAARVACGVLATALLAAATAPLAAQVTDEQVRRCVDGAVAKLKKGQNADGHWGDILDRYGGGYGGMTALAVLALLQAGVPPDDAVVAKGMAALERMPDADTYVVSLRLMAMLKADEVSGKPAHAKEARAAVAWLSEAQTYVGTWGYNRRLAQEASADALITNTDNSNTQMALLALYEAAKAGYGVDDQVWKRSESHYVRSQNKDGGWGYRMGPGNNSYGSMTAAGLASLFVTGSRLHEDKQYKCGTPERVKFCGQYRQNEPIAQALAWLDKNFSVSEHPGLSGSYHYYYLYAVERVGIVGGLKTIGRSDWFREGAAFLVGRQLPDGGFSRVGKVRGAAFDYDVAFAILFLTKGHVPLLVNKLRWGRTNLAWNIDRYDAEHLTRWIGDRLNGKPVGWQTVSLSDPIEQWLEAPLLLVTGREALALTPAQRQKLRQYVEQGGMILADSCCDGKAFADSVRALAAELFPETPLGVLPETHPVYHSFESLPGTWQIEGLTFGCRTPLLLSAKDLSCYWEQSDRPESEAALKMGLNIAAYVTAREPLRDPLAAVRLIEQTAETDVERGALYIGKVQHLGDWNSRPQAMDRLLEILRNDAAVKTANHAVPVKLTDARLMQLPVLYMVGHRDPKLSDAEKEALKRYLERGGFLMAEACCGEKAFDTAFRALMKELLPDQPLEPVPADSPLLNGQVGHKIEKVSFTGPVGREQPKLDRPQLEAIRSGDRYCVVYSPYALGPGLDGLVTFQARGYAAEDARRIAANILLYALNF